MALWVNSVHFFLPFLAEQEICNTSVIISAIQFVYIVLRWFILIGGIIFILFLPFDEKMMHDQAHLEVLYDNSEQFWVISLIISTITLYTLVSYKHLYGYETWEQFW